MKFEIVDDDEVFVPLTVTIRLETEEEAKAFHHLISSWPEPNNCLCGYSVMVLRNKLLDCIAGSCVPLPY